MKTYYLLLIGLLVMVGCQPQGGDSNAANEAFNRNSETVKAAIESWINETPDYSIFSEDIVFVSTSFDPEQDSTTLEESIEQDAAFLAAYDFELVTELDLLPGVNAETKQMDGSVRYYGTWKVTRSATDSTEAKSAEISLYATYDFNEEGKIVAQAAYGDFTAMLQYLNSADE